MAELSKFQAVVQCKCPRCRKGDIFTGKAYSLKLQKTNILCPHCGLKFEREPGYFYVAMYVAYAMCVAEIITLGVGAYILGLPIEYESLWYFIGGIFAGIVLFAPFNYRYSRVILLHWLTPGLNYSPDADALNP
ncbi:DUF983 domain-containing protein [Pedobacter sp. MW01-1-1]|uniref:DUF983 domain-containing protein n=1 Tax=Pedobacter sp. MW01-1-1 TaxID=3383027 RepID=UPI003FEEE12C